MILVIDNYDSFVHNLARYFRQLGCSSEVVRNDQITIAQVQKLQPSAIVLSPGPCSPDEAGCSIELVDQFASTIPILGICLGHQAIVQALGGSIVLANEPVHGRQSTVHHSGSRLFEGIPRSFVAGRYHSLVASPSDLPDELIATARTDDGTIMAVEHETLPVVGLQFHPESILSESGYAILTNFLNIAGIDTPQATGDRCQSGIRIEASDQLVEQPIRSSRLSICEATEGETRKPLP